LNFSWVFKISLPQNEYSCVHRFSTLPSIFLEARAQHHTRLQNPRMIRVQRELIIDGSVCVPYVYAGEVAFFHDPVNFPPDLIQLQVHKLKSQSPIARRKASPTSGLCFANTCSHILIIGYGGKVTTESTEAWATAFMRLALPKTISSVVSMRMTLPHFCGFFIVYCFNFSVLGFSLSYLSRYFFIQRHPDTQAKGAFAYESCRV
jgi:hypothetical protein